MWQASSPCHQKLWYYPYFSICHISKRRCIICIVFTIVDRDTIYTLTPLHNKNLYNFDKRLTFVCIVFSKCFTTPFSARIPERMFMGWYYAVMHVTCFLFIYDIRSMSIDNSLLYSTNRVLLCGVSFSRSILYIDTFQSFTLSLVLVSAILATYIVCLYIYCLVGT